MHASSNGIQWNKMKWQNSWSHRYFRAIHKHMHAINCPVPLFGFEIRYMEKKRCVFNFSTTSTDCFGHSLHFVYVEEPGIQCIKFSASSLIPISNFETKPHIHQFRFCNIDCCSELYSQSNHSLTHTMQKELISSFYLPFSFDVFDWLVFQSFLFLYHTKHISVRGNIQY